MRTSTARRLLAATPIPIVLLCASATGFAASPPPDDATPDGPAVGSTAPAASAVAPAPAAHANPRAKASFRSFSIANLDGTALWLNGAQLDFYPLSRRWVRAGIELEGGAGDTTLSGITANLGYGLAGIGLGFQYPGRVTPFVEGRFAAGILAGSISGALASAAGVSGGAATWMWLGGIDAGIEVYAAGRFYLSGALGWARPTWHGIDYAAMTRNPTAGMTFKDLTADTFTFKLGLGI